MTAKEMFEEFGYEQTKNDKSFIEYIDDGHGDGDYSYIRFCLVMKKIEIGYYDGYETQTFRPYNIHYLEMPMVLEQMKELGWIK